MTKKSKKVQKDVLESANKIWLAGLGALSVAEEEGSRLFNSLVEKGEGFEKRGKKQLAKVQSTVEEQVENVVEKADSAFGRVGKGFDAKVADTLNKLGVPSRMEIQKLTKRVEQLTKTVESLSKKPAAKRTTKAASKKSTAKASSTKTA
jgi:poly(hydroxyalkanoate) granule-associated protein